MAWTDSCKIEAVAQINKRAEETSIRQAIKRLSEESGIPIGTLSSWYWPDTMERYEAKRKDSRAIEIYSKEQEQVKLDAEKQIINQSSEIRTERREEKKQQRAEQLPVELPVDKFQVIYADPPWRYEFAESTTREIENQYPTMSLEEIQTLPVSTITADDSMLFLWATSPKLYEAMAVLMAWGFKYNTCAVWDKQKIGMGYYFRQQHELLLLGKKGNLPVPDPANRVSSVIVSPREKHSKKPDIVYEIIERMYPNAKKIELFSRQPREGWDFFGNETPQL